MKCCQNLNTNEVKRVSDKSAANLVANKNWAYCPKKVWKEQVRDAVKIIPVVEPVTAEEVVVKKEKKAKVSGRQFAKNHGEN